MKKTFCISIVLLHLLNVVGGYWLFYAFQKQNKQELAHQLDVDSYAGSQAITIKLPLSNFKGSDNLNYERVDGEFEYEGVTYRLVKQKFYRDTAYIVCYKDERTIAIKNVLKDYAGTLTDNPTEKKSENNKEFSFIKDYVNSDNESLSAMPDALTLERNSIYVYHYKYLLTCIVEYPPQRIS